MSWLSVLLAALSFMGSVWSRELHSHDEYFTPDIVLSVTRQNISIGGMQRYTTLVNDSLPGPPIRLQENQVTWIRVYNDMTDSNATMVRICVVTNAQFMLTEPYSTGTALDRQHTPSQTALLLLASGLSRPVIISITNCSRQTERLGHTITIHTLASPQAQQLAP